MFGNVVMKWGRILGMSSSLSVNSRYIPCKAIAHHWKANATTKSDIARAAFKWALCDALSGPSVCFIEWTWSRIFLKVAMYKNMLITRTKGSGIVVKIKLAVFPFTESNKHLKVKNRYSVRLRVRYSTKLVNINSKLKLGC